jgi:hypothetical protein
VRGQLRRMRLHRRDCHGTRRHCHATRASLLRRRIPGVAAVRLRSQLVLQG